MREYLATYVGDPERDRKVVYNRALRDTRNRLCAEHLEGKHEAGVIHEDCALCYTRSTQ